MVFIGKVRLYDPVFSAQTVSKPVSVINGITTSFANPLPTNPLTSAKLPAAFAIELVDSAITAEPAGGATLPVGISPAIVTPPVVITPPPVINTAPTVVVVPPLPQPVFAPPVFEGESPVALVLQPSVTESPTVRVAAAVPPPIVAPPLISETLGAVDAPSVAQPLVVPPHMIDAETLVAVVVQPTVTETPVLPAFTTAPSLTALLVEALPLAPLNNTVSSEIPTLTGSDSGARVADEPLTPPPVETPSVVAPPVVASLPVPSSPVETPSAAVTEQNFVGTVPIESAPNVSPPPAANIEDNPPLVQPPVNIMGTVDNALRLQESTISDPSETESIPAQSAPPVPYDSAVGAPSITGPDLFKINVTGGGSGIIDIADNYQLWFSEIRSEIVIRNLTSNEATRIWGENVSADIPDLPLQFWGTSSFELLDGTKVTIETKPLAANKDIYTLDKVTVTNDHRAVILTGIDSDTFGDVKIEQSILGRNIEEDTRDGFTLVENDGGKGWNNEDPGTAITQTDLNETAIGERFAPGSVEISLGELRVVVSRFLVATLTSSIFASVRANQLSETNQRPRSDDDGNAQSRRSSEKRAEEMKAAERDFFKMAAIAHGYRARA
jgi:hypothetical protein